MLAEQGGRGKGFLGGDVAAARHDQVRLAPLVAACPLPQANALRAVANGFLHSHELEMVLLVAHHDIDIVVAAQAMLRGEEQAVGVRRKVDPGHLRAFVDHQVQEARVLMGEPVVVLPPNGRGDQKVERGYRSPPRNLVADGQPLGMLVEHRVDDVNKGLIRRKEAMPSREQVAFEPAFESMLRQHFHDPAVRAEVAAAAVLGRQPIQPEFAGFLVDRIEFVGGRFIWAEQAEIVRVVPHDVPQQLPHRPRIRRPDPGGVGHRHRVVVELRHPEIPAKQATIGVGICPHAPIAARCEAPE